MKHIISFLLLTIGSYSNAAVTAFLSYATFNSPSQGTYVETYISVIANSVSHVKNEKGNYQGVIEISMLFKQGEKIKAAKKYNLLSPELHDTTSNKINFIDQQRILLANGDYDMEITIADKNKLDPPYVATQKVSINFVQDKIDLSDILFLESYSKSISPTVLSKSGYDLIPYVSNFYPENMNKLKFYAEVYHTKKYLGENEKFIVNYFIQSYETASVISNYRNFSKQNSSDVNAVLAEFSIENLASGNYSLVIEVRDKMNQLLSSKKIFFQRKNTKSNMALEDITAVNTANSFVAAITVRDTIAEYIRCLRPISTESEKTFSENQLKLADIELMKQYFLNFWKKRNPINPGQSWLNYYKEVQFTNHNFGNSKLKGYNTDRGRVYLQYGAPDQRSERSFDNSVRPYEIWQYYKLTNKATNNTQQNKSFVFYSPHYTGFDFKLIHSDAIGEIQDRMWRKSLDHSGTKNLANDRDTGKHFNDDFGNRLNDLYNNPR